jgi:hypothetical protein
LLTSSSLRKTSGVLSRLLIDDDQLEAEAEVVLSVLSSIFVFLITASPTPDSIPTKAKQHYELNVYFAC